MPGWHRYYERVSPYRYGGDAVTYFIRLRKPHVVQIVVQTFDLL